MKLSPKSENNPRDRSTRSRTIYNRRPQLSIYNYYIEYGKALQERDIMNSFSQSSDDFDHHPKKVIFKYEVKNTKLTLERELEYLEYLRYQDLSKWIQEFKDTVKLCTWEEETALSVLKSISSPEVLKHIRDSAALKDAYNSLIDVQYPRIQTEK